MFVGLEGSDSATPQEELPAVFEAFQSTSNGSSAGILEVHTNRSSMMFGTAHDQSVLVADCLNVSASDCRGVRCLQIDQGSLTEFFSNREPFMEWMVKVND